MKYLAGIILFFQSFLGIKQVQMPSQPVIHRIKIVKPIKIEKTKALGGIIDTTAIAIPSFGMPNGSTTSSTLFSVQPTVSLSNNIITIGASGSFNSCIVGLATTGGFDGQQQIIIPNGTMAFTVKPKTNYTYFYQCKNNDIQPIMKIGTFNTP